MPPGMPISKMPERSRDIAARTGNYPVTSVEWGRRILWHKGSFTLIWINGGKMCLFECIHTRQSFAVIFIILGFTEEANPDVSNEAKMASFYFLDAFIRN